MNNELMEKFLLKVAIPEVKKGFDRLWDAVSRAHRDVLTGRFYLTNYCSKLDEKGINKVAKYLYEIMNESKEPLSSRSLILILQKKFGDVEIGAIQKLVNMTLKYVLLLNKYDKDFGVCVDSINCDCPLDSVILNQIPKYRDLRWTRISWEQYVAVQEEISHLLSEEGYENCGNIVFDFLKW